MLSLDKILLKLQVDVGMYSFFMIRRVLNVFYFLYFLFCV